MIYERRFFMATITLDIDDALLLIYSKKVSAKGESLRKHLERLLAKELTLSRMEEDLSVKTVVESFHLKGRHEEVPGDELGKNAVAKYKFL